MATVDSRTIRQSFAALRVFMEMAVAVVGHQKGRDKKQRRMRNFGMPKPEGYRKALRVMKLAEKFGSPCLYLYRYAPEPIQGIDAEERGQAEAIAFNLREIARHQDTNCRDCDR